MFLTLESKVSDATFEMDTSISDTNSDLKLLIEDLLAPAWLILAREIITIMGLVRR